MNLVFKRGMIVACALVLTACQMKPAPEVPEEAVVLPEEAVECVCPVVEPPPPTIITQPCPEPVAVVEPVVETGDKYIIGRVENTFLPVDGSDDRVLKLKSRIDTGAGITSIHAQDMVAFERDGKAWVRFAVPVPKEDTLVFFERPVTRYIEIKQLNDKTQRRPVVSMSLRVGAIEEYLDVNLSDRSAYLYKVLIGRNFLRDRAVVDVSRRFIADNELHFD